MTSPAIPARSTPASLCEFMLAGQSASSCDLSISVDGMKGLGYDKKASDVCDEPSTLPAPKKFYKKSNHDLCSKYASPILSVETKRELRKAIGLAIMKDEAARWSSSAEARQASAKSVSQLLLYYQPDK